MNKKLIVGLSVTAIVAIAASVSLRSANAPVPSPLYISHSPLATASPEPVAPTSTRSSTPIVIPSAAPIPSGAKVYSFPSPDNRFTIEFYHAGDSAACPFRIKDKGQDLDGSKLLGVATMDCFNEVGGFESSFMGWADEDKLLIRNTYSDIKIVDPVTDAVQDYQVTSNLLFRGASHTLKYWLFQNGPDGSYVLLDENKKAVMNDIPNKYDRGALYDTANDGFLFMGRDYTGSTVSVRLDFLSLRDLALRNILTTEPVEWVGRGCSSESLASKPGEIILSPGCLTFGSKYYGPDRNIHVLLK